MRVVVVVLAAILFATAKQLVAVDSAPTAVNEVRQLFFDDQIVASMKQLRRGWHRPQKMTVPVMSKERSWEGGGPYLFGTVLRDAASQQFKMWYNVYVGGQPDYFACYATSLDGLKWDRPACDSVSDPRLPAGNNVVLLGSGLPNYRQCLSPTVFYRADDPNPAQRYAMVYWDVSAGAKTQFVGLCLAYSPDGIHWTNHPANPVFNGTSDVTDACYDPIRKRYYLHYKIWRVEGEAITGKSARGTIGNVSYWPVWDTEKLDGEKVRYVGKVVDFRSSDTSPMAGSVEFQREPKYRRVVGRAESTDLLHWTMASLAFELPEQGDPTELSTYGMSVYPYEGQYVGLLRTFYDQRDIDLELAHSRNDRDWKRTNPRVPFLPRGPSSSFDAGMVFSSNSLVTVGDELWFYYGAMKGDHNLDDKKQSISIGLAKLRRDGFVSISAGDQPGELVTVALDRGNGELAINADALRGSIQMELQDEQGRTIPGFSFADSDEFRGDAVNLAVSWKGKSKLDSLNHRQVRIAFRLKNADLYSFWFQPPKTK